MSVEALNWAVGQKREPGPKVVLLALADWADHLGVAWPGQDAIAEKASVTTRTVRRYLTELVAIGVVSKRARMRGDGRGRTSDEYHLHLDQPDASSGKTTSTNRTPGARPTGQIAYDQPDTAVQGTTREPSVEPSVRSLAPAARNGLATRKRDPIWDALMAVCGVTSITPSSRGAYNKATAGLKTVGATPEQIVQHGMVFRQRWPEASLTPTALERRWGECDPDRQHASVPDASHAAIKRVLG